MAAVNRIASTQKKIDKKRNWENEGCSPKLLSIPVATNLEGRGGSLFVASVLMSRGFFAMQGTTYN